MVAFNSAVVVGFHIDVVIADEFAVAPSRVFVESVLVFIEDCIDDGVEFGDVLHDGGWTDGPL